MSVAPVLEPIARVDEAQLVWDLRQQAYWSRVADDYDTLYTGRWSALEDAQVATRIRRLEIPAAATVLDLGCGTGLGARLLRAHRPAALYVGVDLSLTMAKKAARSEGVPCVTAPMDNLDFVRDGCADAVLAIFSTFSYARDPQRLLTAMRRILKPGGYGYVSALGARALSRRTGDRGPWYRTRGDAATTGRAPARRYTVGSLAAMAEAAGLVDVQPHATNAFSGVAELPLLWPLGRLVARLQPDLGHIVEITFHRPEDR